MHWYYVSQGQRQGPVEDAELLALERQGSLGGGTYVWAEGMPDWVPLDQVRARLAGPSADAPPAGGAAGTALPLVPVGFWVRFGAVFLDGLLIDALAYGLRFAFTGSFSGPTDPVEAIKQALVTFPVFFTAVAIYEILMISAAGGTLGKLAFRIAVVDEAGRRLDLRRSTLRYLAKLLSNLTLGVGYLIMVWHPRRQAMHDRMAGTLVVEA
jgi:uncharacterized RDD family membrane protein YckC